MRYKFLFIALLILGCIPVLAQELIKIPDPNLRRALTEQGFMENGQLSIAKCQGLLQLDLKDKGIRTTEGLQYFKQVWKVDISANELKDINPLPPNTTYLNCSNNKLERIDELPDSLTDLYCSNNRIVQVNDIPITLKSMRIENNLITELPPLPDQMEFFNFLNNPLDYDLLPNDFKSIPCVSNYQNCLPAERIEYNFLNAKGNYEDCGIQQLRFQIRQEHGMLYDVDETDYFGESQLDSIDIKESTYQGLEYVFDTLNDGIIMTKGTQIEYSIQRKIDRRISQTSLREIMNDIKSQSLETTIDTGGGTITIDLSTKFNGQVCSGSSSHPTHYQIKTNMTCDSAQIQLSYEYYNGPNLILIFCDEEIHPIYEFMDWVYAYQLMNLIAPDDPITKKHFNKKELMRLYNWSIKPNQFIDISMQEIEIGMSKYEVF